MLYWAKILNKNIAFEIPKALQNETLLREWQKHPRQESAGAQDI
jgi:hypothetical protein